jgi:hypothetical protein
MNKNKLTLIMMTLLTVSALGGVIYAYGQEVPSLAVFFSFASLMINYTLSTRSGLIPV